LTIAYASKTRRQRLHPALGGGLLACASTFALSAAAAEVPVIDAPPAAEADSATALEAVIVTGVRGVRRTVADSPAPVDVISSQQLTATGKVGLKEVLNTLIPSFNLPGINGGGTSWTVRAITMRGLNGDQALFLVNGKRRHGTALINNLARVGRGGSPVDLDLIPASAIERIEVLRDGASAPTPSPGSSTSSSRRIRKGVRSATLAARTIWATATPAAPPSTTACRWAIRAASCSWP